MYQLPELVNAYNDYICYLSMYDRQGIIDLTSVRFFYPTTLLPLITFIKKNGCKYKEPADPNASNYLKLAIVEGEYPDKLDPARSYIPPISLPHTEKEFNDITTEKLLGYLHEWFSQFNLHDILFYLISELSNNVYQHSQHSLAYIMAQNYTRRDMVELSIMDDGITIAGSLGKKIPIGNDSEAIIRALKGYSSKEEKGRGFGLPTSIRIITEEW